MPPRRVAARSSTAGCLPFRRTFTGTLERERCFAVRPVFQPASIILLMKSTLTRPSNWFSPLLSEDWIGVERMSRRPSHCQDERNSKSMPIPLYCKEHDLLGSHYQDSKTHCEIFYFFLLSKCVHYTNRNLQLMTLNYDGHASQYVQWYPLQILTAANTTNRLNPIMPIIKWRRLELRRNITWTKITQKFK